MKSTTLLIKIKYNYGKMRAYPANDVGRAFANIARTKTLPRWVLAQAGDLGFTIEVACERPHCTCERSIS